MRIATLNFYGGTLGQQALHALAKLDVEVLCLQEFYAEDISWIQDALGLPFYGFAPMWDIKSPNQYCFRPGVMGVCVLSRHRATFTTEYYSGAPETIQVFDSTKPSAGSRMLLSAAVAHPTKGQIQVGTTHFTWTENGKSTEQQHNDATKLLRLLKRCRFAKILSQYLRNILGSLVENKWRSLIFQRKAPE